MPTASLRRVGFLFTALVLFAAIGCGGPATSKVSGKIVLPPNTKLIETDSVAVNFMPEDAKNKGGSTTASPTDLTIRPIELPTGKFKVTVQLQAYPGSKDHEKRNATFDTLNKGFDARTSKLTYDVTAEPEQAITIDLGKGTITKGG